MAYMDPMAGYTGYESAFMPTVPEETEEERRRRLAAQQPVTEKITYNADGTQKVTISGTPEALSAANPRTPTVVAPVASTAPAPQGGMTQQQYNAYIARNESGSRPDMGYHMPGKSSAYGTYGITNAAYQDIQRADPQFANRPITSLTAQEQTQAQDVYTRQNTRYLQNYGVEPTQGNLALAHFLGAKGAADYIKTGTISQAAAAANGGEDRVREIAQQRLALGQAPVSGAAQPAPVATAPATPPAPPAPAPAPVDQGPAVPAMPSQGSVQIDDLGNKTVTTPTGETFVVGPDNKPLPARGVDLQQAFGGKFIAAQNDNDALAALAGDKTANPFERQLAKDVFVERYKQNETEAKAKEAMANAAQTGNFNQVSREMKSGGSLGDYLKYMFFKSNGFNEAAEEVANRIGLTDTYQQVTLPDGQRATVRFGTRGEAKSGIDFTGKSLDTKTLNQLTGTMLGGQVTTSGTFFQTPTGQILRSQSDERGRVRLVDGASGQVYTGTTQGLTKLEEAGALRKMDYGVITKYRDKYGTDILTALDQLRKDRGPLTPQQEQDFLNQYRFNQGPAGVGGVPGSTTAPVGAPTPVTTTPGAAVPPTAVAQPAPAAAPAAVAPTAVAAPAPATKPVSGPPVRGLDESETAFRQRVKDYERVQATTEDGRKKIVESASAILADQSKIIGDLNANKRNLKILESGRTNFGTIISGQIPGERAIGELFKTKDAINTKAVMEQINKIAAANAKALGTNPTDRDLIFVTSNIPNESFSEKDVAEWIRRSDEGLRRTLDIAKKQVESGGTYIAPLPEEPPAEGQSPADKARAEIERRKKERK